MSLESERKVHEHDEAGILVKIVAYLIDLALIVLIIPLIYNIYHYLKWGQTLGQQIMGIRIYCFRHHGKPIVASIPQLLLRFVSKLVFIISWAVIGLTLTPIRFDRYPYGNTVELSYQMLYVATMVCWIHAYVFPMWFNKHHRGLQDIRAGTMVAYDAGFQLKRMILGIILCVCLYYFVLVVSPKIIILVTEKFEGSWIDIYRSIWNWIDYWILHGMYSMGLAK